MLTTFTRYVFRYIMNYNDDSDVGYTLEVDLHYPKELHNLHNDYPLAPEKIKLGQCEKLCGTFYDKLNYVIDITLYSQLEISYIDT